MLLGNCKILRFGQLHRNVFPCFSVLRIARATGITFFSGVDDTVTARGCIAAGNGVMKTGKPLRRGSRGTHGDLRNATVLVRTETEVCGARIVIVACVVGSALSKQFITLDTPGARVAIHVRVIAIVHLATSKHLGRIVIPVTIGDSLAATVIQHHRCGEALGGAVCKGKPCRNHCGRNDKGNTEMKPTHAEHVVQTLACKKPHRNVAQCQDLHECACCMAKMPHAEKRRYPVACGGTCYSYFHPCGIILTTRRLIAQKTIFL